jgi:DNA-binding HxlR family transcriptional regulator
MPKAVTKTLCADEEGKPEIWMHPCAIERGMRVIGGKWKGTILWHLKDGPVRFNALTRMLEGASKKMITQRLKELEAAGLVTRTVLNTKPFAVAYEITEEGRGTLHILDALREWAEKRDI